MADNDATPTDERAPEAYEEQNVHEVYQQIAEHFSSTRYKVCSILSSISIYKGTGLTRISAVAHCGTFPPRVIARLHRARCGMRQWQVLDGQ